MKRLRYENGDLDAVDARILGALAGDARSSIAELARLVGLSAPSVSERIARLEEAGVIEGYTLTISPKALGLPIAAWLRIRPVPGQLQTVMEICKGCRRSSNATGSRARIASSREPMSAPSMSSKS